MNYSTEAPSLNDPKNTIYVWPESFTLACDKNDWVYQFYWKTSNGGMGIRIGVRAAPEARQAVSTLVKIWPELWKKETDPERLAELRSELDGPAATLETNVYGFVPDVPPCDGPHWKFLGQLLTSLLYQSNYLCLERFIQWPPRNNGWRSCYAGEGLDKVYGVIQELHKRLPVLVSTDEDYSVYWIARPLSGGGTP